MRKNFRKIREPPYSLKNSAKIHEWKMSCDLHNMIE